MTISSFRIFTLSLSLSALHLTRSRVRRSENRARDSDCYRVCACGILSSARRAPGPPTTKPLVGNCSSRCRSSPTSSRGISFAFFEKSAGRLAGGALFFIEAAWGRLAMKQPMASGAAAPAMGRTAPFSSFSTPKSIRHSASRYPRPSRDNMASSFGLAIQPASQQNL